MQDSPSEQRVFYALCDNDFDGVLIRRRNEIVMIINSALADEDKAKIKQQLEAHAIELTA